MITLQVTEEQFQIVLRALLYERRNRTGDFICESRMATADMVASVETTTQLVRQRSNQ